MDAKQESRPEELTQSLKFVNQNYLFGSNDGDANQCPECEKIIPSEKILDHVKVCKA